MWFDVFIRFVFGFSQGFFIKPFYMAISGFLLILIPTILKDNNLSIFLANVITSLLSGLFLLSILLVKPIASDWGLFVTFWMVSFFLGGIISVGVK